MQKAATKKEEREGVLVWHVFKMKSEVLDKVEKAQRMKARKWQLEEKLLNKAEKMMQEQVLLHIAAQLDRAEAERDAARAQGICRDLQIARLLMTPFSSWVSSKRVILGVLEVY